MFMSQDAEFVFTKKIKNLKPIYSLLKKDFVLEIRQQYNLYGIILYIAATLFVLFLAVEEPETNVWSGLFWVMQLFFCINAVAKSFLQENKGRQLYYYTIASPVHFVIAKLIYNSILMLLMTFISLVLFYALISTPEKIDFTAYLGIALLGGFSLSLVFTFLAAIASKAQQNAAIMAILGFPIVVPLLLLLMKLSQAVINPQLTVLSADVFLLLALDLLIVLLAVILFPFLWKD